MQEQNGEHAKELAVLQGKSETLQQRIEYLNNKVDYFTTVASTGSQERKRLESELSTRSQALNERNANSNDLMAKYFAEKTILTSELSIYKHQILQLQADREKAVLSATKSLSSDLTVALSEWESMEQKLLILEHQVKKAQADSSDNLVKLHKNATVPTEKEYVDEKVDVSPVKGQEMLSPNSSEADITEDTTLG